MQASAQIKINLVDTVVEAKLRLWAVFTFRAGHGGCSEGNIPKVTRGSPDDKWLQTDPADSSRPGAG